MVITLLQHIAEMSTAASLRNYYRHFYHSTNDRAYATVLRLSVVVCLRRMYRC